MGPVGFGSVNDVDIKASVKREKVRYIFIIHSTINSCYATDEEV